jgi:hypothetical protein
MVREDHQFSSWWLMAWRMSSAVLRMCIFSKIRDRYLLMILATTPSSSAISAIDLPEASKDRIWRSRWERVSKGGRLDPVDTSKAGSSASEGLTYFFPATTLRIASTNCSAALSFDT